MAQDVDDRTRERQRELAKRLDAAGWGLFFIWLGVAVLANFGWGVGLVGVGVITLAGQALRPYAGLRVQGFWVAVGFMFGLAGAWTMLGLPDGEPRLSALVPAASIVAGVALVVSALRRGWHKDNPPGA